MPTKIEFAKTIKQKYPQYASMDDAELADKVLAKYPQYQADITDEGGWAPTIARVAGPVLGGIAGSFVAPGPGTIAGGAAGGAAGEAIAQYLEGKGYRPWQIAAQGVIGGVPIPGASAEAPFIRQVAGQALRGAGLGAGATTLSAAAEGQTPSAKDLFTSAGIGAFLGGGLHATFGAHPTPNRIPNAPIPELEAINAARHATPESTGVRANVKNAAASTIEQFQNRLYKPDAETKRLMATTGHKFQPGESPFDVSRIAGAKGIGRAAEAVPVLQEAIVNADKEGLGGDMRNFLDLMGMKAGTNTLLNRAGKLESSAYQSGREAIVNAGEHQMPPIGGPGFEVPPTPREVQTTDRLKAISEQGYNRAESIRNKVEGGGALPEGLTPDILKQRLMEQEMVLGPERMARVKALAQPVFDFNKKTADRLLEYGFIDKARHAELSGNEGYIPLFREIDDQVNGIINSPESLNVPDPKGLKALRGSLKATKDPIEASLLKRQIIETEGARNASLNAFTSFAEKDPAFKQFAVDVSGHPTTVPEGYDTLTSWVNGQKRVWAMPKDIAAPLKMLNSPNAGLLGNTLSMFGKNFQRLATVANAGFGFTNPIRDVMDIAILNPKTTPLDAVPYLMDWLAIFGKNLKHDVMGGRNLERENFLTSGAAYSTLQRNITPEMQLKLNQRWTPLRPVEALASNTEEASKMSMARLLARKEANPSGVKRYLPGTQGGDVSNLSPADIINVRDFGGSPDFGVKGSRASELNGIVPFFNAGVQGIARNIKGIRTMSPTRAISLLGGATAFELARDQWNSQFVDKDGIPSVERMTDNDKQNYFTFITPTIDEKTGRHTSIKISKGHAARILFNPISDVIDKVKYGKGDVAQILGDEVTQFTPGNINFKSKEPLGSVGRGVASSLNPIIKAPVEQGFNENMLTGAPIVPKRLEGLPAPMQSTSTTSPIAKKIGAATDMSPARLQHLIQTFIPGTTGELSTEVANRMSGKPQGSLFGSVTRRFSGSPSDQYKQNMEQVFYDELTKTDEVVQGLNKLRKTDPSAVSQYVKDNLQALQRRSMLTKVADRLGALRNLPDEKANPLELATLQQAMKLLGRDMKAGPGNAEAKRFTKDEIDRLYSQYQRR